MLDCGGQGPESTADTSLFSAVEPSAAIVTRLVEFIFLKRVAGEDERERNSLPNMEGALPTGGVQPNVEVGRVGRKITRVAAVEARRETR